MGDNRERILSLDVFRGAVILWMLVVNNQGDWGHVYHYLKHASWHGLMPTDLIFPFFLYISGMSAAAAARKGKGANERKDLGRIIYRTAVIFLFGLTLNFIPELSFGTVRIPGVLQRIAVCYGIGALIYNFLGIRGTVISFIILIFGHFMLLHIPCSPGEGIFSPEGNLGICVDTFFLKGHTYRHAPVKGFDPEGIVSTAGALCTFLAGAVSGHILKKYKRRRLLFFTAGGAAAIISGVIWSVYYPVNKQLWTGSYVLVTGGTALLVFVVLYYTCDVMGYKKWTPPFTAVGRNAIFIYFFSSFLARISIGIPVEHGGKEISLKMFLVETCFKSWTGPYSASLLYALTYTVLWLVIAFALYRKQLFISV